MLLNVEPCWLVQVKRLVQSVGWQVKSAKWLVCKLARTSCCECLRPKLHCEKLQIVFLVSSARSSETFTYQNSFECITSVLLFQIAWSTPLYVKTLVYPPPVPAFGGCHGICVLQVVFFLCQRFLHQMCFVSSFLSSFSCCSLLEQLTSSVGTS